MKLAILGVTVSSIVALIAIPLWADEKQHHNGEHAATSAKATPEKHHSVEDKHDGVCGKHHNKHEMCVKRLDQVIKAIDAATEAVERGRKATALAELKKAKGIVAVCLKTMSDMDKGKIANARCPIMGTKLNPEKVPPDLTRKYMGRKVGFCCGGCPQQWDKLSPAEKAKKLGKVIPPNPVHEPDRVNKHRHSH
jgi:hypothetical protein